MSAGGLRGQGWSRGSTLPVHAVWPSDVRTPARVRRFVELLAGRLRKEIV
jgi:DNA-binding transcriptional LysR family regulator